MTMLLAASGGLAAIAQSVDVVSLTWIDNTGYVALTAGLILALLGFLRVSNKNPEDNLSGAIMLVSAILLTSYYAWIKLGGETIFGQDVTPSAITPSKYR